MITAVTTNQGGRYRRCILGLVTIVEQAPIAFGRDLAIVEVFYTAFQSILAHEQHDQGHYDAYGGGPPARDHAPEPGPNFHQFLDHLMS